MAAGDCVASTGEIGGASVHLFVGSVTGMLHRPGLTERAPTGVTVKKVASNAAKAVLTVEFILGAPKAAPTAPAGAAGAAGAAGVGKAKGGKAKGATAEAMVPPPSSYDSLPEVLACPPCGCRSACATTAAAHARRQSVSAGVHRSRDRSSER